LILKTLDLGRDGWLSDKKPVSRLGEALMLCRYIEDPDLIQVDHGSASMLNLKHCLSFISIHKSSLYIS
jgi:hypothetical protein